LGIFSKAGFTPAVTFCFCWCPP